MKLKESMNDRFLNALFHDEREVSVWDGWAVISSVPRRIRANDLFNENMLRRVRKKLYVYS